MDKYLIERRLVFDSHLMTLSEHAAVTELAANEAELLSILMQGVATKQAVIEQIWESKGMFVTEGSYHQLVRSLRLKLEERGVAGSLIKTLPRLGLKFVGAVESVADTAAASGVEVPELPEGREGEPAVVEAGAVVAPEPLGATVVPADAQEAAREIARPVAVSRAANETGRRRAVYYAIYTVIAVWAGVLAWKTFAPRNDKFEFRFQQTVGGIHYFSNGKMDQARLLTALNVTPAPGAFVYEIDLGTNHWLSVCPQSIYKAPELCEAYFVEEKR